MRSFSPARVTVCAVLYPPAIAVLKRGEGGSGGFGIKDGIKQADRKGKFLVRQRIIAGLDPSRPSQRQRIEIPAETALFTNAYLNAFGNRSDPAFGNFVPSSFLPLTEVWIGVEHSPL